MRQVLERVNKFLSSLKEEEDEEMKLKEIYIESKNLALPENVKVKNLRIKTLAVGE